MTFRETANNSVLLKENILVRDMEQKLAKFGIWIKTGDFLLFRPFFFLSCEKH